VRVRKRVVVLKLIWGAELVAMTQLL
jgi:hypothetical protein